MPGEQQLVHLVTYALSADLLQLGSLTRDRASSLRFNGKIKLSSKAHCSQQTQWVLIKTLIRLVPYCSQYMCLQITPSVKWIDDMSVERIAGHRVDGKITTAQILHQIRAKTHLWFA